MRKKWLGFFGGHTGLAVLLLIWLLIVATNFQHGTWQSGWDNLHSEFAIGLNLARAFSPAWQEYQGLGLLGGMGHGADLIRVLFIAVLSPLVSTSLIRYVLTFLCLGVGMVGSYFLARFLSQKLSLSYQNLAAFFTGLFFLLNIGTIQNFYAPFEPFYWMYAAFPWLILTLCRYLQQPSYKKLLLFAVVSLLASPMGYLQTAFLVSSIIIGAILSSYIVGSFPGKVSTKMYRSLAVILVIFATNAFWFLPVAHFTITHSDVTVSSQINQIATPEVYLSNQGYGQIWDVLRMRGYWLSLHDYQGETPEYMMQPWVSYLLNPVITVISFILVVILLVGGWFAAKRVQPWGVAILVASIVAAVVLIGQNPPTGLIMTVLREVVPLFKQIFRSPFTKWIVPTSLLFSIMFGWGVVAITEYSQKLFKKVATAQMQLIVSGVVLSLVVTSAAPAFFGNYIYSRMKVELPTEYQELFAYFQQQPKHARIMTLPAHTFWGWNFYDFGMRGSGFLWYGIEQPILDRAFDVWSSYDETFYNQLYAALYSQDEKQLSKIIEQYDVEFAILDKNIVTADKSYSALQFAELEEMLSEIGARVAWSSGDLYVYQLSPYSIEPWVQAPQQVAVARVNTEYSSYDPAYSQLGPYISSDSEASSFPYSQLFSKQLGSVEYFEDSVAIRTEAHSTDAGTAVIPGLETDTGFVGVAEITYTDESIELEFLPVILTTGDSSFELPTLDKITLTPNFEEPVDALVLDIDGQVVEIEKGQTKTVQIQDLVVGRSWFIGIIQAQDVITTDEGLIVDPANAQMDTFSAATWQVVQKETRLPITDTVTNIAVEIPAQAQFVDFLNSYEGYDFYNCDVFGRGAIEKYSIDQTTVYKALNRGAGCEGRFTLLPNNQAHILRVAGQTRFGRPLKFYATNNGESRSDLEFLLPEGEFDSSYVLQPLESSNPDYYTLYFEVRSFGTEVAESYLKLVEMRSIPLQQIGSIRIETSDETNLENTFIIDAYSKIFTYMYDVEAQQAGGDSLLALSQGFDSGWLAFPGWRIWDTYEHVEYNGWANGWIIPGQPAATGTDGDESADSSKQLQITILFWPQLLSFAGYGVLVLTLAWLGWAAWSEKTAQVDEEQSTHGTDKSQRIKDKTKQRLAGK